MILTRLKREKRRNFKNWSDNWVEESLTSVKSASEQERSTKLYGFALGVYAPFGYGSRWRDRACRSCSQWKYPAKQGELFFFVVVNFYSEIVQLQLKSPSFPSIQSRHCSDGQHLIITFTISVSSTILSRWLVIFGRWICLCPGLLQCPFQPVWQGNLTSFVISWIFKRSLNKK